MRKSEQEHTECDPDLRTQRGMIVSARWSPHRIHRQWIDLGDRIARESTASTPCVASTIGYLVASARLRSPRMLTFYGYAKCSTCVNAKKFLAEVGHEFRDIDVTTSPPSVGELREMIAKSGRPYTDFLNRSGLQYRALNMKDKVKTLPEDGIIKLLASEGRLIKRPIVTDGTRVTVGFSPEKFQKIWGR
jgi:arsenate reductase